MRRHRLTMLAVGVAVLAAIAPGCGDDDAATTTSAASIAVDVKTCGELEYGGDGEPAAVIVSDLPMQGDSAERSEQQVEAIRLELENAGWKAGDTAVGFQACDDTIAKTGLWDEATCRSNARAYAADDDVIGVIGTYNSGCAAIEIPFLNEADVVMISPGNTAVCLTEESPGCEQGQPASLYPTGTRNYARVIPNDAFQGAALAQFASDQGVRSPFVLYAADDPTSTGQATNFRGGAQALGLSIAGFSTWDPKASDYTELFARVDRSGADGVVLAGLTELNGGQVISDKVDVVGSNDAVPLIAFDGFAQQSTIDEAGAASRGMFASIPGSAPESLSGRGSEFVDQLTENLGGQPIEQFAPYAGEAAALLLDGVSTAGTDRAAVIEAVFATEGGGGILRPYEIDANGDPTVGPVTILKAASTFEPDTEVEPGPDLVRAAAAG